VLSDILSALYICDLVTYLPPPEVRHGVAVRRVAFPQLRPIVKSKLRIFVASNPGAVGFHWFWFNSRHRPPFFFFLALFFIYLFAAMEKTR